jgi:protein-tyrosine phosphatase
LEDITAHFKKCFKFIDDNIIKGNVFVHCQMGISRSATIVIGYIMKTRGLGLDKVLTPGTQVLEKIKNKRPIVRPNQGFIMQLKHLESELAEAKSK